MRKLWPFALAILACAAATPGTVTAQEPVVPPSPLPVTSPVVTVNNAPGDQLDAHVSGDLVSYTDQGGNFAVHYFRFSTGHDAAIPGGPALTDFLSDVSGERITFTRLDDSFRGHIFVFDAATASLTEVDPVAGSHRIRSAIGSNTVAFIDLTTAFTNVLSIADLANPGPSLRFPGPGFGAQSPQVAPDGNTVVWEQCRSIFDCDVLRAVRTAGTWTVSAVANASNNPDTDGTWIVYDSNRAGSPTGWDIYFRPVAGGVERQLTIPGVQWNPSISGGVISFESRATAAALGDVFVYVIATNMLYQVTSTPFVDDTLTDVTVLDNGDIRVVWAANASLVDFDYNTYATTFTPAGVVHYEICLLYDPLVAKKAGSAYPIKLQLCDAGGLNLSSPSIALHAVSLTRTSDDAPGPLDDTGNANPDFDFRYDASPEGYVFNLSLKCQGAACFTTGTYDLNFTVGSDPTVYSAPFAVK